MKIFEIYRPLPVRITEYLAVCSVALWYISIIWWDMRIRGGRDSISHTATFWLGAFLIVMTLCVTRFRSDVALGVIMPFILTLILVAVTYTFGPEPQFFHYTEEKRIMALYYIKLSTWALNCSALCGAVAVVLMWTPSARAWRKSQVMLKLTAQ